MTKTKEKFEPQGEKYWSERSTDDQHRDWNPESESWIEDYTGSVSHPHRSEVIKALSSIGLFESLLEVGCNTGPNIAKIRDNFGYLKDTELAGVDINPDAINAAKELMPGVKWEVASVDKLPFENKSFDVVLTDAVLMYVGPKEIRKTLNEFDRVAKKAIILVEWYDKSPDGVIKDYHWARNYPQLLKGHLFKVEKIKLTKEQWPSQNWTKNGYIFVAVRQLPTSKTSSKAGRASKSTIRSRTRSTR